VAFGVAPEKSSLRVVHDEGGGGRATPGVEAEGTGAGFVVTFGGKAGRTVVVVRWAATVVAAAGGAARSITVTTACCGR
jgi:hypothetical protein